MKKVALLCDSSADISKEEALALGINVLRMPVIIDGVEYIEEETINTTDIVNKLNENRKVTTTQPSYGEVVNCFETLLKDHDEILYLPLHHKLSGTCQSVMQIAKDFDGKVQVIDSTFVCQPTVTMMKWAKELLAEGYTTQQIAELFETKGELFAILIPKSLTTLKNGGRISPAAAALGGLMKIQPLLSVSENGIDVFDKVRTLKKAYKVAIDKVTQVEDVNDYEWMVIHINNLDAANEAIASLKEKYNIDASLKEFKAVIAAHTGDGTIGIGRIKKVK